MIWKSIGIIFDPRKYTKWVKSHAWVPTVIKINNDLVRVFFAGRDKFNHSNVGAFNISLEDPTKIFGVSKKPVLKKGRLGCFDDCAAIPSHIIKFKNKYMMYYVGWTQGKSVPYISSIGLATSKNLHGNFKRYSEAPILGRSINDPIFTASCFVEKKKKFQMWYTSNKLWTKKRTLSPKYLIRKATSSDGISWKNSEDVIKFKNKKEIAITRPWIVKLKNKTYMLYSYRGKNYKIGCALKLKSKWKRQDHKIKLINNNSKFDQSMKEYASVIKYKERYYMFYNGNNFGKEGIGMAILEN